MRLHVGGGGCSSVPSALKVTPFSFKWILQTMNVKKYLAGSLLASVSLTTTTVFAQVDLARTQSCDNCTEQQRAEIVTSLAKVPGESQVLVVDAVNRRLHWYDVWVDQEPGLFHVTMDERTAPSEATQMLNQVLDAFPLQKEFEPVGVPSMCVSEGSSFAANYSVYTYAPRTSASQDSDPRPGQFKDRTRGGYRDRH